MPTGGPGHLLAAVRDRHPLLARVHLHPEQAGLGGARRRLRPRHLPRLELHVPLLGLLQHPAHRAAGEARFVAMRMIMNIHSHTHTLISYIHACVYTSYRYNTSMITLAFGDCQY